MSGMDDWYGGLAGATAGGGNYLQLGVYDLELVRISRQLSKNAEKEGTRQTIVEMRVTNVITSVPATADYPASNRVGELVALVVEHTTSFAAQAALARFKQILAAALGFDSKLAEVPAEVCKDVGIPEGPTSWAALATKAGEGSGDLLAGSPVRAVCTPTTTTRSKKKIVATRFTAIPE